MKNWKPQVADLLISPMHGIGYVIFVDNKRKYCNIQWNDYEREKSRICSHYYNQIDWELTGMKVYPVKQ